MGLGSARDVSLAKARELAADARSLIAVGGDPLSEKRAKEVEAVATASGERSHSETFGAFADRLIDRIKGGFRNAKHVAQWQMTLGDAYCRTIRKKPIYDVSTADVLAILQPIWLTKAETAGRLRGRIERVLDAAKAEGLREGENPARLRGHLALLLPKKPKLQRGHHAAISYIEAPDFFRTVLSLDSVSARALAFLTLNASRTGEVTGALWREVDTSAKIWTIPAERMKAGREHRVPLSEAAMGILEQMIEIAPSQTIRADTFIFPGGKASRPLSAMALAMCMRGLEVKGTVHGLRSSFRDWCAEETHFAREVAEQALAHRVGDATELAYRRGDALEKRRKLMDAWANFLRADPVDGNATSQIIS